MPGFQSASQVFKDLCIDDVPNLYNYDLKACQAYILQQELNHCNIECPWLDGYLNDTVNREDLAFSAQLFESTWKTVFYALIMGGEIRNKKGEIYKTIKGNHEHQILAEDNTEEHLKILENHFKFLIEATDEWRDYLYYGNDKRYTYRHKGLKHWKNACGMKFKALGLLDVLDNDPVLIDRLDNNKPLNHHKKIAKCKRSLSAFILQGQEAAFIHHLTILCSEDGIPVYKNEHDGLIVGKEIPEDLFELAGERSGFKTPKFVIKPICSPEKMLDLRIFTNRGYGCS
jgi:hypothetical protein